MPALPWTSIAEPDPDRTYVGFATKLPLTAHRHVPGFLRDTMRIRRQLAASPGLVGYSLLAELGAKTFWTASIWEDEASLRSFAAAEPHRSVMRRVPARMGDERVPDVHDHRTRVAADVAGVEGSGVVTDPLRDRPYHHGNLAAAALAAAEEEIARHGIAEASLRKVADRAGVSHTAVGKRFGDKAGLLAAVAAEGYRVLGEGLAAAAATCARWAAPTSSSPCDDRPCSRVMFQPTVYRADDPGVVAARAATTALLRQGVGQPTDTPTSAAAFGAWAFVHGIAALVLGGAIEGDAIELYERAAMALFPGGPPAV